MTNIGVDAALRSSLTRDAPSERRNWHANLGSHVIPNGKPPALPGVTLTLIWSERQLWWYAQKLILMDVTIQVNRQQVRVRAAWTHTCLSVDDI